MYALLIRCTQIVSKQVYHIKDLEDYGDIVLKNIYSLHERGKQLLVLLNGSALTNVGTNSGKLSSFPLDYTELQITINTKRKIINNIETPYAIKHIIQARKNRHGMSKCSPWIV